MFWHYVILTLLTAVANYYLAPKPEPPERPETPDVPFTEEGKEIPVVFGTVELSPFVAWWDGYRTEKIYESPNSKGKG